MDFRAFTLEKMVENFGNNDKKYHIFSHSEELPQRIQQWGRSKEKQIGLYNKSNSFYKYEKMVEE